MNESNQARRGRRGNSPYLQAGWLFADLLLVLAMLFLVANTRYIKPPSPSSAKATFTPTATLTPTMTPLPQLDTSPIIVILTVDPDGLLSNSPQAIQSVSDQMKAQAPLHGRRAGFVIPFGGALDSGGTDRAISIAGKLAPILQTLGRQGYVFVGTSYHGPLFSLGYDYSYVKLEIYLYKR